MPIETQTDAPWGLARISQRPKLTSSTVDKYKFDGRAGEGVDIYVLDTGINTAHRTFEGRARWGTNVTGDGNNEDTVGQGTHLAGTAASLKYGVAKKASVIAVKVAGRSTDPKDIVAGLAWTVEQAASSGRPSVVLIGSVQAHNLELNQQVNSAVQQGLFVVVPAGDDYRDAANYSPAGASGAFTVGATAISDERAYFSNYGPSVNVFAPGLNIASAYMGTPTAVSTMSGTAQAAAHVAGLAAYLMSLTNDVTPANVGDTITALATRDLLTNHPPQTNNLLAFNNATS